MRNITLNLRSREYGMRTVHRIHNPYVTRLQAQCVRKYVCQLTHVHKRKRKDNLELNTACIRHFINKGLLYNTYYNTLLTQPCCPLQHAQSAIQYAMYRTLLYTFNYEHGTYICQYANSLRCCTNLHNYYFNTLKVSKTFHIETYGEQLHEYNALYELRYEHEHIRALLFLFLLGTQQHLHTS